MKGRFITFEGIEGSGKSTQILLLANYLRSLGQQITLTREPGGTSISEQVRKILLNPDNTGLDAKAELLLYAASRAQHLHDVIFPSLTAGLTVLCDRFSDATFAYQGFGRGLNHDFIKLINDHSSMMLKPNLTLLFDLPVEIGLKRAIDRDNLLKESSFSDRFERENIDFHNRVREGYLKLYKNEPERFYLIDATRDVDTIQEEVRKHILAFINR